MVKSDLLEVNTTMKELLNCAIITSGVRYLMWDGLMKMQKLFAIILGTKMEV